MDEAALQREVARRRTFAIISHPDAGKTTITEKLLLFGNAIQMAGTIKARKSGRHATSDWMTMEQERGISVTSSVMQFPYRERVVNLLDTPGHEDFSEDTYRTLTAVDSALMVIDGAKGVEDRTIKLMEVCRLRDTPILGFINKMDRETRDPIEVLDEIESVLGIKAAPINWPIGSGKRFKGLYDLLHRHDPRLPARARGTASRTTCASRASTVPRRARAARRPARRAEDADRAGARREPRLRSRRVPRGQDDAGVLRHGAGQFRRARDARLLRRVGARPGGARRRDARASRPREQPFSGFVFKIQANMDPRHRDRIAFLRVCSGAYEQGMKMRHVRIGKDVRVADAVTFLAGERSADGVRRGRRHHRPAQPRHDPDRRHLHRGRGAEVHRCPALRAGTVPAHPPQGPAEDEAPAEGPAAALRGRLDAGVHAAQEQRPDRGCGGHAAVRGGGLPAARRVQGRLRLRADQRLHRALGGVRRCAQARGVPRQGARQSRPRRRRPPHLPGADAREPEPHRGALARHPLSAPRASTDCGSAFYAGSCRCLSRMPLSP